MNIRLADAADLPAVVDIYNEAIADRNATADLSPVSVEGRAAWLSEHPPDTYPVFVAERGGGVVGWCSLSPYRPGRMALRHTAEISYYIARASRGTGVGSALIAHAIERCPELGLKTLFAIVLDINPASPSILGKFGFEEWGRLPGVADFDGVECGHLYYGLRVVPARKGG
ncbi:MAG: N-acetyltransferase family protein [Gammaproteobacteria bacterium]